jgi:sarcosine oxidase subunit beta
MPKLDYNTSADIVIIGGGIIGVSCAYALVRDGWHVTLIERNGLASGTSSACQGGIGFGMAADDYNLHLRRLGIAEYERLRDDGFDITYRSDGTLYIDKPENQDDQKALVKTLQEKGVACEWLDQSTLHEEEPALSPSITGAAFLSELGNTYPMRVVLELAKRANQLGAKIFTETELTGIELTHGKVTAAIISSGRIATGKIILAAGVWSRPIGKFVDLNIPIWPQKGQILVTEPVPRMLRHFVLDSGYEKTNQALLKVETGPDGPKPGPVGFAAHLLCYETGHILLGSSRQFVGYDRNVDRRLIPILVKINQQLVPDIANLRIIRVYAGLRPWTPDGMAIIGPSKQIDGIYFATGHGPDGNTLSLITGTLIAAILSGRDTPIDVQPLSPDRFVM